MSEPRNIPTVLVAAPASGSGKTSVSLGLARAWRRQGLNVAVFKVGPDFLDPTWLRLAAGREAYNLDSWMSGAEYVRQLFHKRANEADAVLIEGVMGLFDGADPDSLAGSSAEIAKLLEVPVLLVVDAWGMARSIAPLVQGFAQFQPGCRIAGVVANRCGSAGHAEILRKALATAKLPPLLGAIERDALPHLPSRHLGLQTAGDAADSEAAIEALATAVTEAVKLDQLQALMMMPARHYVPSPTPSASRSIRLAVARDDAFHFYYPDNLEALEDAGAHLVYFSPLTDKQLPQEVDGVYIGGGYPEAVADRLSANRAMRQELHRFADGGGMIYAECGGLMYLSRELQTADGDWPMVGVLPFATRMLDRRRRLGYVDTTLTRRCLLGDAGMSLRGHEFHYSEIIDEREDLPDGWERVYALCDRRQRIRHEGYARNGVLASYVHQHFAGRQDVARAFVDNCRSHHAAT